MYHLIYRSRPKAYSEDGGGFPTAAVPADVTGSYALMRRVLRAACIAMPCTCPARQSVPSDIPANKSHSPDGMPRAARCRCWRSQPNQLNLTILDPTPMRGQATTNKASGGMRPCKAARLQSLMLVICSASVGRKPNGGVGGCLAAILLRPPPES